MKLTPQLHVRYDGLKKIVRDSLAVGQKLWGALEALKEEKLYLHDYDTWEEFCLKEFGISVRHADRLIEAGQTVKTLQIPNKLPDPIGPLVRNLNEGQARELKKIPPEKRAAVLEQVAASGPTTAKAIATAAHQQVKKKEAKGEPVFDATGLLIREALLPIWNRAGEVQKLMSAISTVKTALEHAQSENDPLFRPVTATNADGHGETWSGLIAALTNAYRALKLAIPFAICPTCSGRIKNCTTCLGRGFVSEFFWKISTAKETKAIRANVVAKQKEEQ